MTRSPYPFMDSCSCFPVQTEAIRKESLVIQYSKLGCHGDLTNNSIFSINIQEIQEIVIEVLVDWLSLTMFELLSLMEVLYRSHRESLFLKKIYEYMKKAALWSTWSNLWQSSTVKSLRPIPFEILRGGAEWKIQGTPLHIFLFLFFRGPTPPPHIFFPFRILFTLTH